MKLHARVGRALRLAIVGLLAGAAPTRAQVCLAGAPGSCTADADVALEIEAVVRLSLSSATTDLSPPGVTEFDAGARIDVGPDLTVSSNVAWEVLASTSADFWTATSTVPGVAARTDKPASDLELDVAGSGTWIPMGVTPSSIASGIATAAALLSLRFRFLWSWPDDTPGDYSMDVILTVVTP